MQRRTLLKLGLGAGVVLAIAGGGAALWQPGLRAGHLSEDARVLMRAVARAVLDGALPAHAALREQALDAHLQRLDAAIAAFPAATRAELSQLLALLSSAPGRVVFVGLNTPWPQAGVAEVQRSLQALRLSSLSLKQQAYHALRDLTNAAYFSDPSAWVHMGYPGPLDI
ncbi:MAG: hypothetical protein AB7U92_21675 [Piscinibacter sp.]|uniref:hypothetical protein n=1 Tax=Piscinibacter sp. TaxID=1903157 RepID=UPI003D1220E2